MTLPVRLLLHGLELDCGRFDAPKPAAPRTFTAPTVMDFHREPPAAQPLR